MKKMTLKNWQEVSAFLASINVQHNLLYREMLGRPIARIDIDRDSAVGAYINFHEEEAYSELLKDIRQRFSEYRLYYAGKNDNDLYLEQLIF